jgi:hypothetical protein
MHREIRAALSMLLLAVAILPSVAQEAANPVAALLRDVVAASSARGDLRRSIDSLQQLLLLRTQR